MTSLEINIPGDCRQGCEKARAINPDPTDRYVARTMIRDPEADAAIAELLQLENLQIARFIWAGFERDLGVLRDAPTPVIDFFDSLETPPAWVHTDSFVPGIRTFHRNSSMILGAFVGGTLVEGFSTNIAKSFFITGRLRESGVRRLMQNNRHMLELFMPGGMERNGEGWKLSVRVRLVHAQIRHRLTGSDEWDHDAWDMPLCAAPSGFAAAAFSARLVRHMRSLGRRFSYQEPESSIAVWRYAGYPMGMPETILFHREKDALELFEMGRLLEPEPGTESVVIANSLIQSAPLVIGITDMADRRILVKYVYKVSRALIGNDLSDQLGYPDTARLGVLLWFRLRKQYQETLGSLFKRQGQSHQFGQFAALLEASAYGDTGISYRLHDHAYAEESRPY